VSGAWRGPVTFELGEASSWLRRRRGKYDAIVEDLSIIGPRGVTKPEVSLGRLPRLIRSKLAPSGVAIFNLLPVKGRTWAELVASVGGPYRQWKVVRFAEFENRVVIAGRSLPDARTLSISLRECLESIGSRVAKGISVRNAA